MRTIIRGKRKIIPAATYDPPKKNVVGPAKGLVRIKIDGYAFMYDAKPGQVIGNLLLHIVHDLHYRSVSSLLASLTTAEHLLTQISDNPLKPSKQIVGIRKLVDNVREKTKEDPENPAMRDHLITYITEQVLRCEGLGVLHGFFEIMPKLK